MKIKPEEAAGQAPTPVAGAQAVRRALAVLRAVASGAPRHGVRLKDVVEQVGLNAATAHRLLRVLVEEGAVDYDPVGRRYRSGKEVFLLGMSRPGYFPIRSVAEPYLLRLAETTGETIFLIVAGQRDTVILDRKVGTGPVQVLSVEVGARLPMGIGSAGIALLAGMAPEQADVVMRANASRYAARGLTVARVREGVRLARELGYALLDPGLHPGTRSVSVLIPGPDGSPAATLSLSSIGYRLPPTRVASIVATMQDAARQIAARLGKEQRQRSRE
jgi:DNA-binding IclR family transcriptional regulator